jgi:hypothetical protein
MGDRVRFSLALIVMLLAAFPALASPSCMTKHEARARYPTTWLYWHTERHCWDNHRGRHRTAKESAPVQRAPQHAERLPSSDAAGIVADTVSIWPNPPTDFTWADRWPDEPRVPAEKWIHEHPERLFELMQFRSK